LYSILLVTIKFIHNMKKTFFLLFAFALTMLVSIATDVGAKVPDKLQTQYVVSQITMPVMNAVSFESVQAVYSTSGVLLVNRPEVAVLKFSPGAILHLDPGICVQVSVNKFSLQNRAYNNSYSYTPYRMRNNYNLSTQYGKLFSLTARHV